MFKKALVLAVAAASLTSGAAFAQSTDYRNDRYDGDRSGTRYERHDNNDRYDRNDRRDQDGRQYGERRYDSRHDGDSRNDRYDGRTYSHNGGYNGGYNTGYTGQRYRMQRGERLSQYYRGDQYVVTDWRSHRLYAPQRGYQWVQSGNDYALVAIATGIIASVLLNH
jgi:Ni/Co efflux regulator RcnB